jgi:hypothetical protein
VGFITDFAERIATHYEYYATEWGADRWKSGWNDKRGHDRFVEALPEDASVRYLGCAGGSPVAVSLVNRGPALPALIARRH